MLTCLHCSIPSDSFDNSATRPQSFAGVTAIALGEYYTCVIVGWNSAVKCWGKNSYGQLGIGSGNTADQTSPMDAAGTLNASGSRLGAECLTRETLDQCVVALLCKLNRCSHSMTNLIHAM
jgi:hypothetical protein